MARLVQLNANVSVGPVGIVRSSAQPLSSVLATGLNSNSSGFLALFNGLLGTGPSPGAEGSSIPPRGRTGIENLAPSPGIRRAPFQQQEKTQARETRSSKAETIGAGSLLRQAQTPFASSGIPAQANFSTVSLVAPGFEMPAESSGLEVVARQGGEERSVLLPTLLLPNSADPAASGPPLLGSPRDLAFALQLTEQSQGRNLGTTVNYDMATRVENIGGEPTGVFRPSDSSSNSVALPLTSELSAAQVRLPAFSRQAETSTSQSTSRLDLGADAMLEPAGGSRLATSGLDAEADPGPTTQGSSTEQPPLQIPAAPLETVGAFSIHEVSSDTRIGKILSAQTGAKLIGIAPSDADDDPLNAGSDSRNGAKDGVNALNSAHDALKAGGIARPDDVASSIAVGSDAHQIASGLKNPAGALAVQSGAGAGESDKLIPARQGGLSGRSAASMPAGAQAKLSHAASADPDVAGSEANTPGTAQGAVSSRVNEKGLGLVQNEKSAVPQTSHELPSPASDSVLAQPPGSPGDSGIRSSHSERSPHVAPLAQDGVQATAVRAAQPLREVSLRLAVGTSAAPRNVDVQLAERAGRVQVAVRTGDQDLAKALQENLGELVGRLEEKGFKTEAWVPLAAPHGGSALREVASSSTTQDHTDHSGGQGAQPDSRRQQQFDQRRQGRWEAEWERTENETV